MFHKTATVNSFLREGGGVAEKLNISKNQLRVLRKIDEKVAFYIKTIVDFWINSCRSGIRSDIFKTALQGLADYSCNHLRPQILLYLRYADGRDLIPKESDSVMESFKGNILAPCIQYSVVQNMVIPTFLWQERSKAGQGA